MPNSTISQKVIEVQQHLGAVMLVLTDPQISSRNDDPESCDFLLGNPQEMPLPGYSAALKRQVEPQNKDWFAYKMSEPKAQEVIAASLRQMQGITYQPEDITMTTGAFAALALSLTAVVDPGDEVIFLSPPWFFYETLILGAGCKPVRVKVDPQHLRAGPGSAGSRHHPPHACHHRQQPQQPHRQDLLAPGFVRSRQPAHRRSKAHAAPHLPALRRILQPHRLRWAPLPQPDGLLPLLVLDLHLWQDLADARSAHRLHRPAARHAGPRADARAPC